MVKLKRYSVAVVMTVGLTCGYLTHTFADQQTDKKRSEKMIVQMERHWQKVIAEKDSIKREKLIAEHKKMMDEINQSMGLNQHHHMPGHYSHHGLMNTMEMHNHMMKMME